MNNTNNLRAFILAKLVLKYPKTSLNIVGDFLRKKLIANKITPFPRLITLYITNKCNLNCPMCLNVNYRNKTGLSKEIDINLIKKILPELKTYKPFICISGGEPLLNHHLFKIISLLSTNHILTSLTTNGLVLENFTQQIIDSKLEFVSISLDHYKEKEHNLGRGSKVSYQKLINGLNKLVTLRSNTPTNIKVNTVIRRDNYRDLSKMYDFIENLKIDEWALQHYSFINPQASKAINSYLVKNPIGNYIQGAPVDSDSYFSKKEIIYLQKQLDEIAEKSQSYKTKLSIKPRVDNLSAYYQGVPPSIKSDCIWPFESLNIMEGTKVALCLGNKIGDLKNTPSLKKIWQSDRARGFQNLILKEKILPLCFRCCGLNYIF